jgi:hypothetical protein
MDSKVFTGREREEKGDTHSRCYVWSHSRDRDLLLNHRLWEPSLFFLWQNSFFTYALWSSIENRQIIWNEKKNVWTLEYQTHGLFWVSSEYLVIRTYWCMDICEQKDIQTYDITWEHNKPSNDQTKARFWTRRSVIEMEVLFTVKHIGVLGVWKTWNSVL